MTDEQKEKLRATYEKRHQMEEERKLEREHTISILREIRDDPEATTGDRLRAITLLNDLLPKF